MKEFNESSLKKFNGKDEKKVYIAYKGKVYDATNSKFWKTGTHMNIHNSGKDLTSEIFAAPHNESMLERLTIIGVYKDPSQDQRIPNWLNNILETHPTLKRHPHPISVHLPLAYMMGSSLFALLFLIFGYKSFETTSFYLFVAGLIFSIPAILTGLFTWWLNYRLIPSIHIKLKILFTILVDLDALALLYMRVREPTVFSSIHTNVHDLTYIYLILILILTPLTAVIGYNGGELAFPTKKSK
ncbi:MAG TPA: cytochrome b5 [Thermodesulfobium narugense]|nr:MAG: cytochrome b5 [Thermodesulfobium narugense]HEM56265.1 cytochrome b5 [Thermodesulfobium narugense]